MTAGVSRFRRLARLLTVLCALTASQGAAASSPDHVLIVLDVSADMWQPMRDGLPRWAAAREAILTSSLTMPARGSRPSIAIRLLGADTVWSDDQSCSDTRLLRPLGPPDPDALRLALAPLVPGGRRPLLEGVTAGVADLPTDGGRRRLILVLAGDDDCGAGSERAAQALASGEPPVELRIVGVAMPHDAAGRFARLAPTRNAATLAELHAALTWALHDDDSGREPRGDLELTLTGDALTTAEPRVQVVPTGEQEGFVLRSLGGGRYRSKVDPGRHVLRVIDPASDSTLVELGGVAVASGARTVLHLDLPQRTPVTVEPLPWAGVPPGLASVAWYGAPESPLIVTVTAPSAPIATSLVRRQVAGASGVVDLPFPAGMRDLEARLLEEVTDGVWRLLGRADLSADRPLISIEAPDEVETGSVLDLTWKGSSTPGDRIVIEPAEGDGRSVCVLGGRPRELRLPTPSSPGTYRVRYLDGMTGRTLASRDLLVILIEARLQVAESVTAGDPLPVGWDGPGGDQDFLTMVPAGAPDDDYRLHTRVGTDPPTQILAPESPGAWEVRYVEGATGRVLARAALEVTARKVELEVPSRVPTDRRFAIHWRGPASDGDLITVAPAGSLPMRMLDWAPVSMGDPLTLAAPADPGEYEVRYVSTSDRTVRASVRLEVVP